MKSTYFYKLNPFKSFASIDLWRYDEPINPRISLLKNILVIGGGFSGLASALGAARRLDELGISSSNISITIINLDGWHSIRVRNYEPDITNARVSLAKI